MTVTDPDSTPPLVNDVIDRLVDGELSPTELGAALDRLDREPDGWKRCTLAFLEVQCWRESFRALDPPVSVPVGAPSRPMRLASAQELRRFPGWRRGVMAAGIAAVSFATGWLVHPAGPSSPVQSGTTQMPPMIATHDEDAPKPPVEGPRVLEPSEPAGEFARPPLKPRFVPDPRESVLTVAHVRVGGAPVPILAGPQIDEQWIRNQPPALNEYQLRDARTPRLSGRPEPADHDGHTARWPARGRSHQPGAGQLYGQRSIVKIGRLGGSRERLTRFDDHSFSMKRRPHMRLRNLLCMALGLVLSSSDSARCFGQQGQGNHAQQGSSPQQGSNAQQSNNPQQAQPGQAQGQQGQSQYSGPQGHGQGQPGQNQQGQKGGLSYGQWIKDVTASPHFLTFVEVGSRNSGMSLAAADDALRAQLKFPKEEGLIVTAVEPGSPAASAGIEPNDVLLRLGSDAPKGIALGKPEDLETGLKLVGDSPQLLILLRRGRKLAIKVQPEVKVSLGPVHPEPPSYWIGVGVGSIEPALRAQLQLPEKYGLLALDVVKDSPAATAGVRPHDLLLKLDGEDLTDQAKLIQIVQAKGEKEVSLQIVRRGEDPRDPDHATAKEVSSGLVETG